MTETIAALHVYPTDRIGRSYRITHPTWPGSFLLDAVDASAALARVDRYLTQIEFKAWPKEGWNSAPYVGMNQPTVGR